MNYKVQITYHFFSSIIFVFYFNCFSLNAVDIGSDTAVTRFTRQQFLANGDRIAGFASLNAGFLLGGAGVIGTFDSAFPVAGSIELNAGTLVLNQDLILNNVSSLVTLGNISGNTHKLELSPTIGFFATDSISKCIVSFVASAIQADFVNSVDWSFDGNYLVVGLESNSGAELLVYAWDGTTLTLQDSESMGSDVNSVAWHPSKDFIAIGTVSGSGDELFTYTFDRSSNTLTSIDSVNLGGGGNNSVNEVAWHPDGDHLAVASDSNTQEVIVYEVADNGDFGASVTATTVDANSVDWNSDGTFLAVGTIIGASEDELLVYSFSKSPASLVLDASFNVAQQVNTVRWNRTSPHDNVIAIGLDGGSDRLQLYRHDGDAETLTQITTRLAVETTVNSVDWRSNYNCLIAGLNNNTTTKGELRVFEFQNDTLTQVEKEELAEDVLSVRSSPDAKYVATGDDGTGSGDPDVAIYRFDSAFVDLTQATFSSLEIIINNDVVFNDMTITFSGNSLINGRGNTVTFSTTCTVQIDESSQLHFLHMTLKGLD